MRHLSKLNMITCCIHAVPLGLDTMDMHKLIVIPDAKMPFHALNYMYIIVDAVRRTPLLLN